MIKMIKNKLRLVTKLFIIVWAWLIVHVILKLTFNYWQPYVIPNERLQIISDFIDRHIWIRDVSDLITYTFNGVFVILSCLQLWKFKDKKQTIITFSTIIICYGLNHFLKLNDYTPFITTIILPLVLNYKKWFWVIASFVLNNLFLALSLWLAGFVNCDDMPYIIQTFFFFDYYIMMILCYFVFNFIRERREK